MKLFIFCQKNLFFLSLISLLIIRNFRLNFLRCIKITADLKNLSPQFFKSNEFFPIEVNFGDKETIKITKRPRKTLTEIVDIYANSIHIGMFVGIEKVEKELKFGPAGINKSHSYRNILNFTFVKLMEYYSLDNLSTISINIPEDNQFKLFLVSLGFEAIMDRMILKLAKSSIQKLIQFLSDNPSEIESQVGQIQKLIQSNLEKSNDESIFNMVDKIVNKIKNMDPLGKKFWDNRKIAQLNYYMATALLFPSQLEKKEFLDMTIKTIISSLEIVNREAYLHEILKALENKCTFPMDYIQKLIDQLKNLVPKEIKKIDPQKLKKWAEEMKPVWKLNEKKTQQSLEDTIAQAQLKESDFGPTIKEHLKLHILDLIQHYNGTKIYFGVNNRI